MMLPPPLPAGTAQGKFSRSACATVLRHADEVVSSPRCRRRSDRVLRLALRGRVQRSRAGPRPARTPQARPSQLRSETRFADQVQTVTRAVEKYVSAIPAALRKECNRIVEIVERVRHRTHPRARPTSKISPTTSGLYCTWTIAHRKAVPPIAAQASSGDLCQPRKRNPRNSASSPMGATMTTASQSQTSNPAEAALR